MTVSKELLVQKLDQLEKAYREWKVIEGRLTELFGGYSWEGSLGTAVDTFISTSVDMFSELSGICLEALWWWILDADWGKGRCNGCNRVAGEPLTALTCNKEFVEWELVECL